MVHMLLAIIYLAFISLGLPDSLLGSAWPSMHQDFSVPVSYAGGISMIIAASTILSSLQCDRLTRKIGTGRVTTISVFLTAAALFGFSVSHSYIGLCLWAVPYGLGAGCVDASLNNYVALHYASRHMSWLHCMWGVGASVGPYIMGAALSDGQGWNMGYRSIALIQIALTAVLVCSLPLWRQAKMIGDGIGDSGKLEEKPLSLRQIVRIPGAREVMFTFFCYSAVEQTTGLWASSYLVMQRGVGTETAAAFASLFYIGITAGRALSGFLAAKLTDTQMIRIGQVLILCGVIMVLVPNGEISALCGLVCIGFGCAPVFPSIIHATPAHFGAGKSQALIGVQMAASYAGTCIMPPVFGLFANHIGAYLFPWYLLLVLALMILMQEKLLQKTKDTIKT